MLVGSAARRLALGTLLSLVVLGSAASASPTAPPRLGAQAPNVTFGLGPSTATAVDGRPYYNYAAAPGAVIHDHVAVLNYSSQALPLRLYAADGYNTYAGASNLRGADKASTDLGGWVHLASRPGLMLVPGRTSQTKPPGRVIVPFTLVVPRNAAVGDHVGGLVLALRTRGTNAQGFLVSLDQRVGVQIFTRVAGPLHPALQVVNLKATYHDSWNPFSAGSVTLTYTVRNVGNVRLGGRQRATVSAFIGSWRAHGLTDIPMLVPGGTAHVRTTVHGVWPEFLNKGHARVTALALATDVNPATQTATASVSFWAVPWALMVFLLVLRLVYVFVRRWRRARSGGPGPKHARLRGPAPSAPEALPVIEPVP
jgi:hypothetical protein